MLNKVLPFLRTTVLSFRSTVKAAPIATVPAASCGGPMVKAIVPVNNS